MSRSQRIAAALLVLVAFLVVSAGLARVLSANSAERSAVSAVLAAQASGDAARLTDELDGCAQDAACRATARENARELRSSGEVELVRLDLSTSFSLTTNEGTARVVWATPTRLTVVQCARVRRGGDVIGGLEVSVLALSRPIGRETSCP